MGKNPPHEVSAASEEVKLGPPQREERVAAIAGAAAAVLSGSDRSTTPQPPLPPLLLPPLSPSPAVGDKPPRADGGVFAATNPRLLVVIPSSEASGEPMPILRPIGARSHERGEQLSEGARPGVAQQQRPAAEAAGAGPDAERTPTRPVARSIVWRSIVLTTPPDATRQGSNSGSMLLRSPSPPPLARLNPYPVFAGPEAGRRVSADCDPQQRVPQPQPQQQHRTGEVDEGTAERVPVRTRIASLARLLPEEANHRSGGTPLVVMASRKGSAIPSIT